MPEDELTARIAAAVRGALSTPEGDGGSAGGKQ